MSGQSRVILVHGVYTPEGDSNIGRLFCSRECSDDWEKEKHR